MPKTPYEVEKKEKEALLNEYRLDLGKTISEVCEEAGITSGDFAGLNNGMISPVYVGGKKTGDVKPWVQSLCTVLGADFYELFPRYSCKINNDPEIETVSQREIEEYGFSPDINAFFFQDAIEKAMSDLTEREVFVLSHTFGLHDGDSKALKEIALMMDITKETVRQILAKAGRKLRHPSRSKFLKDYIKRKKEIIDETLS